MAAQVNPGDFTYWSEHPDYLDYSDNNTGENDYWPDGEPSGALFDEPGEYVYPEGGLEHGFAS